MRLIDAHAIKFDYDPIWGSYDGEGAADRAVISYQQAIRDTPTVYAVPISELIALRDDLYDMDAVTFRGLAKLNQLIAKYDEHIVSNTLTDEQFAEFFEENGGEDNAPV